MAAGHPARPVRGRAGRRIDDTLSVVDKGTAYPHREGSAPGTKACCGLPLRV